MTKRLKLEFLSQRWQSHSEQGVKEFIVRCKEGEDGDDENIAEIVNFCEIRKVLVRNIRWGKTRLQDSFDKSISIKM